MQIDTVIYYVKLYHIMLFIMIINSILHNMMINFSLLYIYIK